MSTTIKSLCIDCIDSVYTADYIMKQFYNNNIASINRITLLPIRMTSGVSNKAYIDIAYWHDSETAYNFIKGLKTPYVENRFLHNSIDGLWWKVTINYKLYITQDPRLKQYTHTNTAFEYQNEIDISLDKNIKKSLILSNKPKVEQKVLPKVLPKVEQKVLPKVEPKTSPKTNKNGAKLLAYINVKEDQEDWIDIEKDLNGERWIMQNEDTEWMEIEKELNNARIMMQKLDYEF
jgi:hypothetical protein